MVTLGEKLKGERLAKGISLDKMAKDLNTTKATLSRYENNLREPRIDFIRKVADYFDCSVDYLLDRTENKKGILITDTVNDNKVEIEVDKYTYPDGLTHDEVINILNSLKKAGFNWKNSK